MLDEDRDINMETRLVRKRDFIIMKDTSELLKKMIADYALLKQTTPWELAWNYDSTCNISIYDWLLKIALFSERVLIYSFLARYNLFVLLIYLFTK